MATTKNPVFSLTFVPVNLHENYIKRCIYLAKNTIGTTYPNPGVGAVIVYDNKIIGEGYTSPYGGSHAEVNAINSVKDKSLLAKSTLYVTLEPCSHFGKTPPCSDLIIRHKIPYVVIGAIDTNKKVAGKGIKKLIETGCNVTVGVLEDECHEHHKRFFTYHNKNRPYIILKWAESKDGFISPLKKDELKPVWITNQYSRQLVHKWRSEEQGILVGTKTVTDDNPKLNTRLWNGKSPVRIVIDRHLKTPRNYSVWDGTEKTIFICELIPKESLNQNLIFETINFSENVAHQICEVLYKHECLSVIIEGGSKTIQTFISEGLWDEARVFKGDVNLTDGTKAPYIFGEVVSETFILNDSLKIYRKHD